MIKLLSLFSGIGAFEKALERQNIEYELVGFSEIDKFAIKSYCAIHNISENKNLGDITKINIDKIPGFDIMTWGFPCQDISIAGKLAGLKEGQTRSGLYFEGYKILKAKLPQYSVIENVKNLVSKRFINVFNSIIKDISELGYNNYWKVLNAKDFGIPQNRERIFLVSIRKDIDDGSFEFPEPQPLKLKLKDILENNVEEKYYLTEKGIGRLIRRNNKLLKDKENPNVSSCIVAGYYKMSGDQNQYITDNNKVNRITGLYDNGKEKHQAGSIYNTNGLSPTLTTMDKGGNKKPYILVREATNIGYTKAMEGDSINISYPNSTTKRGRVGKEISQTILTSPNIGTLLETPKPICLNNGTKQPSVQDRIYDTEGISTAITASQFRPSIAEKSSNETNSIDISINKNSPATLISEDGKHLMRIRKLTPLECWRLMGFDDSDFTKVQAIPTSDTQLYKQAGNSIVVNVLEKIFNNLFLKEDINDGIV